MNYLGGSLEDHIKEILLLQEEGNKIIKTWAEDFLVCLETILEEVEGIKE